MGGSSTPGPAIPTPRQSDCSQLMVRTILASPVAAVLQSVNIGDQLLLRLEPGRSVVIAVDPSGRAAGSIISPDLHNLIDCIRQGNSYTAKVLEIEGGRCVVQINWIGRA